MRRARAAGLLLALAVLVPGTGLRASTPDDPLCTATVAEFTGGSRFLLVRSSPRPGSPGTLDYRITPAAGLEFRDGGLYAPGGKYPPEGARFEYGGIFAFADGGKREAFLAAAGVVFEREGGRIVAIRIPQEEGLNTRLRDGKFHLQFHTGPDLVGVIPHLRLAELLAEGKIGISSETGREWFHDRLTHLPQYLLIAQFPEVVDPIREHAAALVQAHRTAPTPETTRQIENLVSSLDIDGVFLRDAATRPGGTRDEEIGNISAALYRMLIITGRYRRDASGLDALTKRVAGEIYDRMH